MNDDWNFGDLTNAVTAQGSTTTEELTTLTTLEDTTTTTQVTTTVELTTTTTQQPTTSDPCSPHPCNTGTCAASGGSYTCTCTSTHYGTQCQNACPYSRTWDTAHKKPAGWSGGNPVVYIHFEDQDCIDLSGATFVSGKVIIKVPLQKDFSLSH